MSIKQLVVEVKNFFESVLGKEAHVIGVQKNESGWRVEVETIEDSDYMRKRALDDVVGLYEVNVNEQFQIVGYQRIALRERDSISQENDED